jgi:hypothetical protein
MAHWSNGPSVLPPRLGPAPRLRLSVMVRYFFDVRDNDSFYPDDEGLELPSIDAVKAQTSRTMGEIAKDVLPGSKVRILTIEVRDDLGPVLRVTLRFEIEHIR